MIQCGPLAVLLLSPFSYNGARQISEGSGGVGGSWCVNSQEKIDVYVVHLHMFVPILSRIVTYTNNMHIKCTPYVLVNAQTYAKCVHVQSI